MLVLFGDHGENMIEHDAWFDHAGLYDSVVRVPLIIRCPGRVPRARVDALVQLVDVMPTVLELLGQPAPDGLDGRSLMPVVKRGRRVEREAVMLSECTWQAKRGVRTEEWKYIRCYDPGIYPRFGPELYQLAADPCEQDNIAAERPDVVAQLDSLLQDWLDRQLDGRPDPLLEVLAHGLPAIARLASVVAEDLQSEDAIDMTALAQPLAEA